MNTLKKARKVEFNLEGIVAKILKMGDWLDKAKIDEKKKIEQEKAARNGEGTSVANIDLNEDEEELLDLS